MFIDFFITLRKTNLTLLYLNMFWLKKDLLAAALDSICLVVVSSLFMFPALYICMDVCVHFCIERHSIV